MLVCKSNRDRIITIERVKFSADKGLFWLLFDKPHAKRMNLAGARCTLHNAHPCANNRPETFYAREKEKKTKAFSSTPRSIENERVFNILI